MAQNSQAAKYGIMLVTASSEQEAQAIAKSLVESSLAACVSLLPIQSIYIWESEIHQEREWQLLIKTELAKFDAISAKIQQLHSYQVPEIIAIPLVAGFDAYLQWISAQVT